MSLVPQTYSFFFHTFDSGAEMVRACTAMGQHISRSNLFSNPSKLLDQPSKFCKYSGTCIPLAKETVNFTCRKRTPFRLQCSSKELGINNVGLSEGLSHKNDNMQDQVCSGTFNCSHCPQKKWCSDQNEFSEHRFGFLLRICQFTRSGLNWYRIHGIYLLFEHTYQVSCENIILEFIANPFGMAWELASFLRNTLSGSSIIKQICVEK